MDFFDRSYSEIVESPNGVKPWWHNAPLPDGQRIRGAHPDIDRQYKLWESLQIPRWSLFGKTVLDIGANDGFFSIAAAKSGGLVTSIDRSWATWPKNITYLSERWFVQSEIVTGDFQDYPFSQKFDVILCLGVIYHLENVFAAMKRLKELLASGGAIYIESHLTNVETDMPIWEAASDLFKTSAPQAKVSLATGGISNFLLPNAKAIIALADTFGMLCEELTDSRQDPRRGIFKVGV